jgi:hypothetical protein
MAYSNTETVERDRPESYQTTTGRGPANGTATAALVLGILSVLFAIFFFPLGILLGIVAIVLGVMGRGQAKRGLATNGGAATGGLVTGVVGVLLGGLLAATTPQARQACINQDLNQPKQPNP